MLLKRSHLAEDAVARVFEDIWEKRAGLRVPDNVRAYLYAAVRNRSVNLVRANNVFLPISACSEDEVQQELAEGDDLDARLRLQELDDEVERLLAQMPQQRQIVFKLNRFENLRYKEIAAVLGISERTVQNHMVLAMKQLSPDLPRLREMIR
jgi:RNA polymerase sigma-70 factor (ECF subfamily)